MVSIEKSKVIKRIIAREGLIILGILLVSAVSFSFGSGFLGERPYQYIFQAETGNKIYEFKSKNWFLTNEEVVSELVKQGIWKDVDPYFVPDDLNFKYLRSIKRPLLERIRRPALMFSIFFPLSYPLYLVARFVFWATRSLRAGT